MKDEDAPVVDVSFPDITPYRAGNTGVDWVWTFSSGRSGPHLGIVALMHGNEVCGAVALDRLMRADLRPRIGALTLAFANIAAYHSFDPVMPTASRYIDEDMNRVWSPAALGSDRETVELRRARDLLPCLLGCDGLLDIHSMHGGGPALTLCGLTDRGLALAKRIGSPAWIVRDGGHVAGARLIDHDAFAAPDSPRAAVLVECGQHWEQATAEVATTVAVRFLERHGLMEPGFGERWSVPAVEETVRVLDVTTAITVETGSFAFERRYAGMEVIAQAGTLIAVDGDREIRTPYDDCVLVMPSYRLRPGQTAVRLGRLAT